jgi:outer membrane protein, multidrug efflux system
MKPSFFILPLAVLVSACKLGPDFKIPGFTDSAKWKETNATSPTRLPDDWWRLFNDSDLTQLIQRAHQNNNDLAAAKSRLDTSRALVGLDRARLFPTLSLSGNDTTVRASDAGVAANLPPGVSIDLEQRRFRAGFDLAYDPDLWGRNKRLLEASTATLAASEAQLDSQRLGTASEVARQYFLLRGLDAQESIVTNTVKSRKEELEIQQSKTDAGLIDALSVRRASTELELSKNDLASIQRQRGSAEHALAVLCGSAPSSFSVPSKITASPLPTILPGLPAEVLSRRPDVRVAEQTLRAASARIGVAEAAFYPNFSLTSGLGFESLDIKQFLDWENRVLSLGAGFVAPVFDGGTNRANYKAEQSRYQEALAAYRQVLLIALREVEDAMMDLKGLATSQAALNRALASARDTKAIAQERYEKGLTSYLEVVDADRSILQISLTMSANDSLQRTTLTSLARALGGGWSHK